MDNLTHSLLGLAAAKAGLERLSPRATTTCLIAANLPDSDIVVLLFGDRWTFLQHHRGITHSIIGTIVLALILPTLFYFTDQIIAKVRSRQPLINPKGLIVASLVVGATHPFLDWTNNYGIRLLLPWSQKWIYGDFVFIIDPYLWLTFGGAAFLLTSKTKVQIGAWLFLASVLTYLVIFGPSQRGGLADPVFVRTFWIISFILLAVLRKLGATRRWCNRIAVTAFTVAIVYLGALAYAHRVALEESHALALLVANQNGESVTELAAMPTLASPFRWQTVFETDQATYRFNLALRSQPDLANLVRYERSSPHAAPLVAEALKGRPARIFMDFARFPVARVDPNCIDQAIVQLADLRYTEPGSARGSFALEVPVECPPLSAER
ncbi:MAG TPA: metal-dependent hydrolase [Pyrinomonadaceae bacterium]|nr:metal-dependent hydrolase [Pyrinomonadaceae bacterium]